MSKLNDAIELCKDSTKNKEFNKGLTIFNALITNSLLDINTRVKALLALINVAQDLGNEKISQARDKLSHLKDDELDREVKFICTIIEQPNVSSHERLLCAVTLYNYGYFELYYDLFSYLANDISVLINYRVEAT